MCYDTDARPPLPPNQGSNAGGADIQLTAKDGNQFAAYFARASNPTGAQALIYPDVRGLRDFYKDLALRFAEQGVDALAIDYFGRTAGLTPRDDSFDYMPHVQQMQLTTFYADVQATLDCLHSSDHAQALTFTVGFCIGGTLSLMTGTQHFDLAGIIAFYPGMTRTFPGGNGTALDQASQIHYPVLGLFGGADAGIPVNSINQLAAKLDEAEAENQIVIYPNAPHSFFDRKATDFVQESADAWMQVLDFISSYSSNQWC